MKNLRVCVFARDILEDEKTWSFYCCSLWNFMHKNRLFFLFQLNCCQVGNVDDFFSFVS